MTKKLEKLITDLVAELEEEKEYALKVETIFCLVNDSIVGKELKEYANAHGMFCEEGIDSFIEHFVGIKTGLEIATENLKECLKEAKKDNKKRGRRR